MDTASIATSRPRDALASKLLPPITYLVLTLVFWGRFVLERGLHAETVWIELSQQRPGWEGFLYPYDASRRFMSVPFHAAYLVSNGSYLPLHLIFGLFVFLTGWLTWLLGRRLLPNAPLLAFIAGALALVHGADLSTNTTPMIVVRQAVVAILGAALCIRLGWDRRQAWLLVPAALLQALSLWTYEAGVLLIVAVPLILWSGRDQWRRWLAWTAGWAVIPTLFVASLVQRYAVAGESSYQSAKLSSNIDPIVAGKGVAKLLYGGLAFWTWPGPWYRTQMQGCVDEIWTRIGPALFAGTAVFLLTTLLQRRSWHPSHAVGWRVALIAAACLIAAYLPFLVLGEVGAWRTQFYAAPPAAVVLATLFTSLDTAIRARGLLASILATTVAASGMFVGLVSQLEMSYRWRIHRQVMDGIVRDAPRLADGTLVVVSHVPTGFPYPVCDAAPPVDPFLDTFWFHSALRVLYPHTKITGVYWRSDLSSPGAIQYRFDSDGAALLRSNTDTTPKQVPYERIVAFHYDDRSGSHLVEQFPAAEIPGSVASPRYAPHTRIPPGPPPAETVHRLAQ